MSVVRMFFHQPQSVDVDVEQHDTLVQVENLRHVVGKTYHRKLQPSSSQLIPVSCFLRVSRA